MAFKTKFKKDNPINDCEALFRDLRNRKVEGLLSHQADMLRQYNEGEGNARDVAFELPTGSGKTLVGLLIGEYRRRTNHERVVYLCPTKQLVNQVVEDSRVKYGIKTNAFTGSQKYYDPTAKSEYNTSEAIAVTTYSSLFNTNPFFQNPNVIILDDAHSAENYLTSFWSLSINRADYEQQYRDLVEIIKEVISPTLYQRLVSTDPSEHDLDWVDKIPTPILSGIIPSLTAYLDVQTRDNKLSYPWAMIRDHLHACHFYMSWRNILIRPIIPPSLCFQPFADANQRIYMSATLGIGGDLERITGISNIHRLPIPPGWDRQGFGRKLFFFPEISLPEDDAFDLSIELIKHTPRSLILVPSDRAAETYISKINELRTHSIFLARDIETSKSNFVATTNAAAVLANRYDGIDLVGDECRLVILKDLPKAANLQEKFLESRMAASILLKDRNRTRTVQAVGRCTRSATDYSAVCVLGQALMDALIQKGNIELFHPELQGELSFGFEESKARTPEDLIENLRIFFEHGDDWEYADSEIVERRNASQQIELPAAKKLKDAVKHEVNYLYKLWNGDFEGAVEEANKVLLHLSGDDVKGYRAFWYYLAGSVAWLASQQLDPVFSEKARQYFNQAAQCSTSVTWLRGLSKLENMPAEEQGSDKYLDYVIEQLEVVLSEMGTSSNRKFEKEAVSILENLKKSDAKSFEAGHTRLGRLLGFLADNSEDTAAPDPWWIVNDDFCFVFEDKTDGDDKTPVSVHKTDQAARHPNWIRDNVSLANDAVITPIMITTAKTIDKHAVPNTSDVLYWHIDDFREWAVQAIGVVRRLQAAFTGTGDLFWRTQARQVYKDAKIDPVNLLQFLKNQSLRDLPIEAD